MPSEGCNVLHFTFITFRKEQGIDSLVKLIAFEVKDSPCWHLCVWKGWEYVKLFWEKTNWPSRNTENFKIPAPHSNKTRDYWNAMGPWQKLRDSCYKGLPEMRSSHILQAANCRNQYIDRVYLFKSLHFASGFDVVSGKKPQRNLSGTLMMRIGDCGYPEPTEVPPCYY